MFPISCTKPESLHWPPALYDLASPLLLLLPCSPVHCAPAMLVSVLFLKHAKHSSASGPLHLLCPHTEPEIHMFPPSLRALLQCHLFSEGFPNLLPPLLQAFPILPSALLFSKASPLVKQHTYFSLFVCRLRLLLECKLHEGRVSLPVSFYTLFLVPTTVLAHSDCSVHIVEWMNDAQPDVGTIVREDVQPTER